MVPILFHSTARTTIGPAGQRHLLPVSTGETGLDCSAGFTFLCSRPAFAALYERKKKNCDHATSRIERFIQRCEFISLGDVFDNDPSVLIHDLRRFLVGKVGALVRNALMNFCHGLFGFYSFRRSFLLKSQFPLGLRQSFGGAFQERRVFDGRSIGKSGKGFDPHIDHPENFLASAPNLEKLSPFFNPTQDSGGL